MIFIINIEIYDLKLLEKRKQSINQSNQKKKKKERKHNFKEN